MPQNIGSLVNKFLCGEAKQVLKQIPGKSIDCVVTSPPYWNLRDYGVKGQLGLEPHAQDYVAMLCDIFDEVKRILKKRGTCWVNLGDTYATPSGDTDGASQQPLLSEKASQALSLRQTIAELPKKCLVQIPARFALEMVSRGWILRNE